MKSKKHTIFLFVSLAVFAISAIIAILDYSEAKSELDCILSEVTDTQLRVGLESSLFFEVFFTVGVLGTELSFIRSVYKILKYKPNKLVGTCYIISASLAVLTVAFYCFDMLNMFDFVSVNGRDYAGDIYLFTLWPSFIVSFVLGSIPIKHHLDMANQNNSNNSASSD